jgi:hypothetical protein
LALGLAQEKALDPALALELEQAQERELDLDPALALGLVPELVKV